MCRLQWRCLPPGVAPPALKWKQDGLGCGDADFLTGAGLTWEMCASSLQAATTPAPSCPRCQRVPCCSLCQTPPGLGGGSAADLRGSPSAAAKHAIVRCQSDGACTQSASVNSLAKNKWYGGTQAMITTRRRHVLTSSAAPSKAANGDTPMLCGAGSKPLCAELLLRPAACKIDQGAV